MTSVALDRYQGKLSLEHLLPDLSPGRKERHGSCPFCGGEDRFMVFADSGRGWCRQCLWKGDAIQLLIDRDGLTFIEAKKALGLDTATAPAAKRTANIHSLALAAAKRSYTDWQRHTFTVLVDDYRDLCTRCDLAEIAYRAAHRAHELYSDSERSLSAYRLAAIYDRLAVLEHDLDILTIHADEPERFAWWQESEVQHG